MMRSTNLQFTYLLTVDLRVIFSSILRAYRTLPAVRIHDYQKVDVLTCLCVCLAVTFLEYWKRKTAEISYIWDCYDFEEAEASRLVFLTIWQTYNF